MLMISWQGGTTGVVVFGKHTSATALYQYSGRMNLDRKTYDKPLHLCHLSVAQPEDPESRGSRPMLH